MPRWLIIVNLHNPELEFMPQRLFMLLTTVDQRLTEIYFTTVAALDHMLALQEPTSGDFGQALASDAALAYPVML